MKIPMSTNKTLRGNLSNHRRVLLGATVCVCLALSSCDGGVEVNAGGSGSSGGTDASGGGATAGTTTAGTTSGGTTGGGTTGADSGGQGNSALQLPIANLDAPVAIIQADNTLASPAANDRFKAYAGAYNGDPSVFLLNDDNLLIGLVQGGESFHSVRADFSDVQNPVRFQQFTHRIQSASSGFRVLPFATVLNVGVEGEATENQVQLIDGQTISTSAGGGASLNLALQAADSNTLLPISSESVQGQWIAAYTLCDSNDENCSQIGFDMTITGDQVTGSGGVYVSGGADLLPSALSGSIAQKGQVLQLDLRWNTYAYRGFLFVDVNNPDQLLMVVTTDSEIADERMLAGALVRYQ